MPTPKRISEEAAATSLGENDLFVIVQGAGNKTVTQKLLNTLGETAQSGASYTVATSDQVQKVLRLTNASTKSLTLPPTSGFTIGRPILIRNVGAGDATIYVATGVTAESTGNTLAQHGSVTVRPRATDVWEVYGQLTGSPISTSGGGDTTAPTISSIGTNSTTVIRVVFSESVTVTTAGWSFKKNGSNLAITSVSGSGTTWDFIVGTMAIGDTLLYSYNPGTGNTVDGSSNELASATDQSVTNSLGGGVTLNRPTSFGVTGTTSTSISLGWTDANTSPNESGIEVEVATLSDKSDATVLTTTAADATSYTHSGLGGGVTRYYRVRAKGNGTTTLDSIFTSWQTGITSGSGDTTAPSFVSAIISNSNPSRIVLTYDETLDSGFVPTTGQYAPLVNSALDGPSSITVTGATVQINLSSPVAAGDTVTLDYAATGANRIRDLAGNLAALFTGQPVTNNVVGATVAGSAYMYFNPDVNVYKNATPDAAANGDGIYMIYDQKHLVLTSHPNLYDLQQVTTVNQATFVSAGINGKPSFRIGYDGTNFKKLASSGDSGLSTASSPIVELFQLKLKADPGSGVKFLRLNGGNAMNIAVYNHKLSLSGGSTFTDTAQTLSVDAIYVVAIIWRGTTADVSVNSVPVLTGGTIDGGASKVMTSIQIGDSSSLCAEAEIRRYVLIQGEPSSGDLTSLINELKTDAGI